MTIDLSVLKKEIPFKWRVQSFSKKKEVATCVAYVDARDVMNLLDEGVGAENWQSDFKEIKGNLYAGIGIRFNSDSLEWVWKWDCGTESNTEKEKGEASDSFKRAGVKWGIGRFLYDLPMQYIKTNEKKNDKNYPYCVDDNGKQIWDLTEHINKKLGLNKTKKPDTTQVTNNNVINIDEKKKDTVTADQKEMQKDFTFVFKNGTIHQWTNLMAKWLKKKPELANNKEFETWVNKYKPNPKSDVELMEESTAGAKR